MRDQIQELINANIDIVELEQIQSYGLNNSGAYRYYMEHLHASVSNNRIQYCIFTVTNLLKYLIAHPEQFSNSQDCDRKKREQYIFVIYNMYFSLAHNQLIDIFRINKMFADPLPNENIFSMMERTYKIRQKSCYENHHSDHFYLIGNDGLYNCLKAAFTDDELREMKVDVNGEKKKAKHEKRKETDENKYKTFLKSIKILMHYMAGYDWTQTFQILKNELQIKNNNTVNNLYERFEKSIQEYGNPMYGAIPYFRIGNAIDSIEERYATALQSLNPETYRVEMDKSQLRFLEALIARKNIVCSGIAGTGKTAVLLKYLEQLGEDASRVAICAFTGKAALNVHGATIHSFFKLGVQLYTPENIAKEAKDKLANVDTIIIDEFSTVRCDLNELILEAIKQERLKGHQVNIVYVGDMGQMGVFVSDEEKVALRRVWSKVKFLETFGIFASPSFEELNCEFMELTEIHRCNDAEYNERLLRVRTGDSTKEDFEYFNQHFDPNYRYEEGYLHLCATNKTADNINQVIMNRYKNNWVVFDNPNRRLQQENFATPLTQIMYVGMRVQFTANSKLHKNGELGTLTKINQHSIWVKADDGRDVRVKRKKIRATKGYQWARLFPVRAAYAITIYKSQGSTLRNKVVVHLDNTRIRGQAYTALSRVTSFRKIYFAERLKPDCIVSALSGGYTGALFQHC